MTLPDTIDRSYCVWAAAQALDVLSSALEILLI